MIYLRAIVTSAIKQINMNIDMNRMMSDLRQGIRVEDRNLVHVPVVSSMAIN